MSTCKSCGATIVWMKTDKGKNIPVDWFEVPWGRRRPTTFDHETMVSHFATCPNADKHRKPR